MGVSHGADAERMRQQWRMLRAEKWVDDAPKRIIGAQSQRAARITESMGARDMALGAGFVDRNGPAVGRL